MLINTTPHFRLANTMADIMPTLESLTGSASLLDNQTSMASPEVTPFIVEYNQTTLKEMMNTLGDCFELSNQTNLDMGQQGNNTMYATLQPLNNSNCLLFNGNASLDGNATMPSPVCNPYQEYFSWSYALVGTMFQSIILVVGVLGNVLTCTVVQRTRSMHTTTNCYLGRFVIKDS